VGPMREVLFRVRRLLSRRAIIAWWVVLAAIGCALTWLPLLGQPGYELALGLTLVLALPGGGLAIAAARARGAGPLATGVVLVSATGPALLLATLRTLLGTPCDPFASVGFVPLLVLPTAALVAVLGAVCARLAQRGWTAAFVYAGFALLSALSTAWPLVAGPQVYAYNHLGGFVPGPLYDEELLVPPALWWFRLATLCLAGGLAAWLGRRRTLALALLAGFLGLELEGPRLGFRMNDQALAAALGGALETDELVVHYPAGLAPAEVRRFVEDARFRYHQDVAFFGAPPPGKVRLWLYRSPEEKQRLVGAAHTQFAKPWRREVHVNGLGFPHPVLKHELVHAMAAPWGAPPFGVAASLFGLAPHVGVIEGLAVAADNPVDDLSLHEWAAAMKRKGLLPDVARLMTAEGFYGAPASRAYTTAGSFLRFLADRLGKERLRALYRDGDFERAFGQDLDALARQYTAFLDTVPLEPDAVNQAFGRFRRGSLFDRPCAREVGRLAAEAAAAGAHEPLRARQLLSRCRLLQPDEPSHVLAWVQLSRRLGLPDEARALLDAELERLAQEPAPWAEAALARADLAQEEGDVALASQLWGQVLARQVAPALERTATVRLDGREVDAVQRYFAPGDEAVKLVRLREAAEAAPPSISARYLLGRRLQQEGASAEALPVLAALLEEPLPPSLARETARLAIEAAFAAGRCDTVERLAHTARLGASFDARAADWLERCAFTGATPQVKPQAP
jgi:hypothetical protein